MAYTAPQIGTILLKADRTMYKIGQIAYENMFAEDNEALDYERDIIFIYKKAVEFADDFFVGTDKLDKVVERLAVKISAYDYGELNPIYADANTVNIPSVVAGAALNDLSDVTITNLLDNQIIRYNAATGQWINVGPGAAVRNSQAFTATAGQTVFTTSYPFDAGLFDLYVNGVKLNSLSYTTFGEYQITLNDPCIVGDIIDVVIYDPNTSILPSVNSLDDLSDVTLGPLANNQVLYYNAATGFWQNAILPSLTGYIPYTGATTNVDLGEFGIRAGQFTLDTSPTGTATVGTTRWNDNIGSSETTLKGGSVILKNGVDLVARVVNKVTPNTTLTKAGYAAVRVSGAQGQRLAVAYAQANNDANSADTIGLVTETIATNQEGFIITVGHLEEINTTGSLQGETWVDGDVLYLSPFTPGAITKVKPIGNGHIVVIGYVEYAHAIHGKIYVKTMNGWELDELHDVSINTGTLANGDVLKYNSTTQLWENGVSSGGGGISGSGTSGQVTYWSGASAVSGSSAFTFNPTPTASSALGVSLNLTPTLTAAANNDVLTAIDLQPTFTNGAFTGVSNYAIRATGQILIRRAGGNATEGFSMQYVADNTLGGTYQSKFVSLAPGVAYRDLAFVSRATLFQIDGFRNSLLISNNGNVVVNSLTDASTAHKFQVYGDTLLRGSGSTISTTALTVQNSSSTNLLRVLNNGDVSFGADAMYWDAVTSRLGIGTNAPAFALSVATNVNAAAGVTITNSSTGNIARSVLRVINNAGENGTFSVWGSGTGLPNKTLFESTKDFIIGTDSNTATGGTSKFQIYVGGYNAVTSPQLSFHATANLSIGSTSDNGQRLQVYGDTLLRGSGATSATTALTVQDSGGTAMLTLRNDGVLRLQKSYLNLSTDLNVAIGASNNGNSFINTGGGIMLAGANRSAAGVGFGLYVGNVTNTSGDFIHIQTTGPVNGANFAPTSGTGTFTIASLNATINQTGGANGITRGLYVNPTLTAAADFRAIETARGNIVFSNLPTSSAGLPSGALWNNAGVINIV